MKAVVLAAGLGRRIGAPESGVPKPLRKVLGLPLIKRVILSAREAGIREFIVVTGYLGEKIRETLGEGRSLDIKITYVENRQWERGNGLSLLRARDYIDDRFILLMGDHLFDPEIIKDLKEAAIKDDEVLLVVDTEPASYIDLQDATKVRLEEGRIKELGKGLKEYDGVDCGIFLCGKDIFRTLQEEIDRGRETITDTMNGLARKNRLFFCDSRGRFWIDIDTEEALKRAEETILKGLIKPTDGIVSKYLNRPISIRISRWLVEREISPNMITFISFLVSVVSAIFLSLGNYVSTIAGGILVQISSIIDGCDGEVARLRFQSSEYGAWFDSVLDRYADGLIILGMVIGLHRYNGGITLWVYGYLALMGTLLTSYTAMKYDALIRAEGGTRWRFGRDTRMLMIMTGALLNEMYYLLITLMVVTNLVTLRRLYILRGA